MRHPALLTFAVLGMAVVLPAQTPDPSATGPLAVSNEEYKFAGVVVPAIPYPVDIWATVFYPTDLPKGPYPLVMFLHGNHGICRLPNTQADVCPPEPPTCPSPYLSTPQHQGYNYVAQKLASYGYIVASLNANAINCRANAIPERGRLVQEHLRRWALWNSGNDTGTFGTKFRSKVDFTRVGLMGHSRGGEGVLAAYNFNRQEAGPAEIKAVFEISPVDFGRSLANPLYNANDVAFSVILSGCDNDVSDNQGMRVFDRAMYLQEPLNPSMKSQQYVWGVNHDFFNSEWTTENPYFACTDLPIITTRPPQEAIGAVYLMGFMRTVLGGEDFKGLFTGDVAPPPSVTVPVDIAYNESPSNNLMVERFSDANAPFISSTGGFNSWINLDVSVCSSGLVAAPCTVAPSIWFHDPGTFAAKMSWPQVPGATASFSMQLTGDGSMPDLSGYKYLTFRVAEQYDARNPQNPATQDFTVQLASVRGSSVPLSAASYRNIPYPTGLYRKSVMKTIRIPLADFGLFDRTKVARLNFIFDRTPSGSIYMSDIEFTH